MILPYEVAALIAFPGIILHQISHRFVCYLLNISVYKIPYFEFNQKANHILHGKTISSMQNFYIYFAPLVINTLAAMIFLFPYGFTFYTGLQNVLIHTNPTIKFLWYTLIWLGGSFAFHAIPSDSDIKNIDLDNLPIAFNIFGSFLAAICSICNINYIGPWIKITYGWGISLILPMIYCHFFYMQ